MCDTGEIWKPIDGYFGKYEVSDHGRVRSWTSKFGRPSSSPVILCQRTKDSGHKDVNLCLGGRLKRRLVHHLVILAFEGPPRPGDECRHLDGNPSNNCITNLKWGTRSENQRDRDRHGTRNCIGSRNPNFRHGRCCRSDPEARRVYNAECERRRRRKIKEMSCQPWG